MIKELLLKIKALFEGSGVSEAKNAVDGLGKSSDNSGSALSRLRGLLGDAGAKAGVFGGGIAALIPMVTSLGVGIATTLISAVKSLISTLVDGVKSAAEFAASMTTLSDKISAPIDQTVLLQQVFSNAGLSTGKLQQATELLRQTMAGVAASGQPSEATFARLGLSMDKLRQMSMPEQFRAIGAAINGLHTPTAQAAAATALFGKAGQDMLAIFRNDAAFATAIAQVEELSIYLKQSGAELATFSAALKGVNMKIMTFWAAVASQFSGELERAGIALNDLKIGKIGEEVGYTTRGVIELVKGIAELGEGFNLAMKEITGTTDALQKFGNFLLRGMPGIGGLISVGEWFRNIGKAAADADLAVKQLDANAAEVGRGISQNIMDTARAASQGIDTSVEGWQNKIQQAYTSGDAALAATGTTAKEGVAAASRAGAERIRLTAQEINAAANSLAIAFQTGMGQSVSPALQGLVTAVENNFLGIASVFSGATQQITATGTALTLSTEQMSQALASFNASAMSLQSMVSNLDTTVQTLDATLAQVGPSLTAIATSLTAGVAAITESQQTATATMSASIQQLGEATRSAVSAMGDIVSKAIAELQSTIAGAIDAIWKTIANLRAAIIALSKR